MHTSLCFIIRDKLGVPLVQGGEWGFPHSLPFFSGREGEGGGGSFGGASVVVVITVNIKYYRVSQQDTAQIMVGARNFFFFNSHFFTPPIGQNPYVTYRAHATYRF